MAKFWQWLAWILVSACALAAPVFGSWGWPVLVIWAWVAVAHKGALSRLTQEIETIGGWSLFWMDMTIGMFGGVVAGVVVWGSIAFLDPSVTLNPAWAVIAALTVGVLGFRTLIKTIDRM